ncbi:MAG: RNA polymerase sigma factor [Betaproteobacteria bacterium]|nr:RNA polymerase sigma factor [Betaproteobacteria bacterium]
MPVATPPPASDEDLMQAYAAGDAAAFDRLYGRHKGGVYRYLLRHCGCAPTADELFQDIWMSVVRARATYTPSAKFSTWLYRIAHNRLVDHWRARGPLTLASDLVRDGDDDPPDPLDLVPGTRANEPETRVASRELAARIRAALAALPPAQRNAFLLHQEGGLELSAIAELTGDGVETVKSRIRYALDKLRAQLGDLRQDFR